MVTSTPARPAIAAPMTNTREITRSVLMPRIAAIRRSCWVARQMRPSRVYWIIQVRVSIPTSAATRINTLVQVICTTPSPTVMRSAPLSSVGIPCWFGPWLSWT